MRLNYGEDTPLRAHRPGIRALDCWYTQTGAFLQILSYRFSDRNCKRFLQILSYPCISILQSFLLTIKNRPLTNQSSEVNDSLWIHVLFVCAYTQPGSQLCASESEHKPSRPFWRNTRGRKQTSRARLRFASPLPTSVLSAGGKKEWSWAKELDRDSGLESFQFFF